jgi:hypothetical protein
VYPATIEAIRLMTRRTLKALRSERSYYTAQKDEEATCQQIDREILACEDVLDRLTGHDI